MENAKHTPGPWVGIDPKTKKFRSTAWKADNEQASSTMSAPIKAGRETVALVVTDNWDRKDELHANARLIAAAPELLEALKQQLCFINVLAGTVPLTERDTHRRISIQREELRAAIAKATWSAA